MNIIRALFALSCAAIGFLAVPGGLSGLATGTIFAVAVIALELKLHTIPPNALMGGIVGTFIGLILAIGFGVVGRQLDLGSSAEAVIQGTALLTLGYLGMVIGGLKGQKGLWWIPWQRYMEDVAATRDKILDSSVLIDGRIAEVCETGFVDGTLVMPQFVLAEMQQVADSSDPLRRARGRRGLDLVQRLQRMPGVGVELDGTDFADATEVDQKLIELAIRRDAQVITNDFNLAKVAEVRGIKVLNVNDLANALKPAYLPGEPMSVRIVKDGKEAGQGVGYLDDGTMVVVDGARSDRGATVDMAVTSVLQTSAGKMIFGKKIATSDRVVEPSEEPSAPVAG